MSVPEQAVPADVAPAGSGAAAPAAAGSTATAEPPVPEVVRRLTSPAALALADLAAVLEDLQTVLRCCERLVAELHPDGAEPDDLALEAFWTTAVLSYARCFAPGDRGTGLTEADVEATGLQGDVVGWHRALLALRERSADPAVNPREAFTVGAAVDATGHAEGVAIASTRQPSVDEVSVRQTGAVAYALSGLVDERLGAQQAVVLAAAAAMARPALDRLAPLHLVRPPGTPGGRAS